MEISNQPKKKKDSASVYVDHLSIH